MPAPGVRDVVVVGAGPAGSATARRLAQAGYSVELLERSHHERPRVGETLPPSVQPELRALGVWDRFLELDPLPSWGTRSVWASTQPEDRAHVMGPHGSAWHVDRRAVDQMLAEAAQDAGANLRAGWPVTTCDVDGEGWHVRSGDSRSVRARVLVDATGRRSGPGRLLGARRETFDHLVAIAGGWSHVDVAAEQYLLVEAVADGWWYTAPLPSGERVGLLLTDAALCRARTPDALWHEALRSAELTSRRVGDRRSDLPLRVHAAGSSRMLRHHDHRPWLAVGDAALAVDPLSGSGVVRALRSAERAAETVATLVEGDHGSALPDHESARDRECLSYLVNRAGLYGSVQRFDTPFWALRSRVASAYEGTTTPPVASGSRSKGVIPARPGTRTAPGV